MVQRIAFKAVIVNSKNQLLLLREAPAYEDNSIVGKYHFPGGRLEIGEAWQDGLKREIKEETGFESEDFLIDRPLHIGEWRPNLHGTPTQIIAVFMVCKLHKDSDPILSNDHDDFVWLSEGKTLENCVDEGVINTYFKTS